MREELQIENETRETRYSFPLPFSEDDVRSLMRGIVPVWLQEACRGMVEISVQTGRVDYVGMRDDQQRTKRRRF